MLVGNKIFYYRKKYKITQVELGEKISRTKQYISKLERDQLNVGVSLALEIIDAFRVITKEKTFGMQMVNLKVEDIFYLKKNIP
ncbi:helix-turn-helix transcriptional regulator [Clostridium estertheticum]|uniref:helix-turn-helix transcriptional regulator n=1 Tax=Clostridium estertheticum TaxID=238834 RepID=UPI001C7CDC68|nr:helix-turn-helix transcriptional regulator [Clostridium estertheticum]MBX4267512.1 helix-turn-helix domain-containing protein [Clostridium estertheticum]WLC91325.1 helix-turn-helix domain-containing protein [Clostridium estertheticum]